MLGKLYNICLGNSFAVFCLTNRGAVALGIIQKVRPPRKGISISEW